MQQIHYKRQLYLEHLTQYGKYSSLKLEASAVAITVGSRVPGRKKSVPRDGEIIIIIIIIIKAVLGFRAFNFRTL